VISTRVLKRKSLPGESFGYGVLAEVPVTTRVVSTDAVVKVPAGEFEDCLEIQTDGFAFFSGNQYDGRMMVEIKNTRWYARGAGLVKSLIVETSTSDAFAKGEMHMELESLVRP